MDNRSKRIEAAQLRVLFAAPFFAPGVAKLPVKCMPGEELRAKTGLPPNQVATACTDGNSILMANEFMDSLSDAQLVTLLCHEVCHPLFGHLWRAPVGGDMGVWNQACDYKVNAMLKDYGATVTERGLADPFPFPEPAAAYCFSPEFSEDSEESVYNKLMARKTAGAGSGKGKGGKAAGGSNGAQGMPNFGQFMQAAGQTPSQAKASAKDWERTLIQSVHAAKSQGQCPAGFERLVNQLLNPKVAWQEILRSLLREQCADDWDFLTPALEWTSSDFIMPSMRSDRVSTVVFAIDTSGSVDDDLLAQFKAEMQGCLDNMRPRKLVEICCDSVIHAEREYGTGDMIKMDAPGGGGTSFVPVMERCANMEPMPKAVVYLTDLQGDFGTDPGFPVIWVGYGGGKMEVPYGQLVEVAP